MSLQDTVLELFEEKRIDKAAAYRLLHAARQQGAAADAATPDGGTTRLSARLRLGTDPDWRLALMAYLLHLASGQPSLELDVVRSGGTLRVTLDFDDQASPRALVEQLRVKLLQATPPASPAAHAWVAAGARDAAARQIALHELPSAGGDADECVLEFRVQPHAQGVTAVEDWPETLQHFHDVFSAAPGTRLAELDRLPPRHKKLIERYNATATYLPPARTLPELLDPVLELEQDALAVQTRAGHIDYAQYRHAAWRIAHELRAQGVQRNERVLAILHRSVHMPVGLYGIVCAGGAYVPLEPDLPAERIAAIAADTGARLLVTDADTLLAGRLPLAGSAITGIVCVDAFPRARHQGLPVVDATAMQRHPPLAPRPVNQPGDTCYVIYTSGSTGKPKGVMIGHEALVNTLIGVNNVYNLGSDDRVLGFSSCSFDLSVWDMFGSALAAATLVLPTKAETRDPAALWSLMHDFGATVWNSVPTAMSQLMAVFNQGGVEPLASLRLVMLGGEQIQRSLPGDITRAFPNSRLSNLGGATEGTIWSIFHYPVLRFEPHWKTVPYGKPLPNQRFHVLNDLLKPCAIGEKGMLWIGGMGVAQGYLGDAERTRAAFVPAPWSADGSERIYRTGDLGVMRADGLIDISGRVDHQIKLRGFRVELGEIEAQLEALDGITQSAVIARRDDGGSTRLVAFYASRDGEHGAARLRAELGKRLPDYMLPGQFVHLADPPVTTSGKLDRRKLEAMDVAADTPEVNAASGAAPANALEAQVATELARILRLPQVGVEDDFFLIGGDSLLMLQYLSVLSRLGLAATPADIQAGRSIRGVLARVEALADDPSTRDEDLVPLTPMSRKFLERLPLADRDHWQQLLVVGFDHVPDMVRLRHALTRVNAHHPLLRARFAGKALQVAPAGDAELPLVDLSRVPMLLRGARMNRVVEQLRRQAGLGTPSLAAAVVVKLAPHDVRLLWVLHHLVVDASCWRTLVDDLASAYRDRSVRLLRAGRVQDLVAAVRRELPEAIDTLGQATPWTRMPVPRRAGRDGTGVEGDNHTQRWVLAEAATRRLFESFRDKGQVNLNLLLLTTLALALKDWADQDHVRFDVISNGRSIDPALDFSRSIGWFATHNPFGVELPDDPAAALKAVQAAWERYQVDSRLFVEVCNEVRGRPGHPLASHVDQALLYSFLGDFDSLDLPEGWNILGSHGVNRGPANARTHELELETLVARGCLMVRLVYPTTQIPRSSASRLLRRFRERLDALVTHLEQA